MDTTNKTRATSHDEAREMPQPRLYVIRADFCMSAYILHALDSDDRICMIEYKKRKTSLADKVLRWLRAYVVTRKGLWTDRILDHDLLAMLPTISPQDKVLLFGVENMKDLSIILQETEARDCTIFMWNTVKSRYEGRLKKTGFRSFVKNTRADVCTFDPHDADHYHLRLLNQVYRYPETFEDRASADYDIFYIGMDKHRSEQLAHIKNMMEQLRLDFYILKDKDTREDSRLAGSYHDTPLAYEDVLKRIQRSRAILEILQEGQDGSTLRALEALFLRRKLITNNRSIKDVDFYCPDNILVLDQETTASDISQFLQTPMAAVPEEIIQKYNIISWIQQFL